MKLLDRYCFSQFFVMLMIGTTLPAGIFLLTSDFQNLVYAVKELGCPLDYYLMILFLHIPQMIVRSLPAGVVMATVLVFHRFMKDSEMVALRTNGCSIGRLFRPFLITGVFCSILSFFLNEIVVPPCLNASRSLLPLIAEKRPANESHLQITKGVSKDGKVQNILMFANRAGNECQNAILFDFSSPNAHKVFWSPHGVWRDEQWHFAEGHGYVLLPIEEDGRSNQQFEKLHFPKQTAEDAKKIVFTKIPQARNLRETFMMVFSWSMYYKKRPSPKSIMEIHQKLAEPAACLFLMIATLPAAIGGQRRNSGTNFTLVYGAFIVVGYFVMLELGRAAGVHGRIDPKLATWFPNYVLAIIGGVTAYLKIHVLEGK